MKKALIFLFVFILTICAAFPALAVVDQSEEFYVADYADVFTKDFEERIIQLNGDLEHYCDGAQLVVVTVEYLDGMYSDEYAMRLFNNWGVGDADANNGMLLLLAVKENKAWLTVGKGISLSTNEIDEMFEDHFWKDFDNGDYQDATEKMLDALTLWYTEEYNVENTGSSQNISNSGNYEIRGGNSFSLYWMLLVIIIIVLVLNSSRRYRSFRRDGGSLSYFPWLLYYSRYRFRPRPPRFHRNFWSNDDDDDHFGGGGFGGGGGGSSGGGFGGFGGFGGGGGFGGSGRGGGGFGGGGGGRR